MADGQVNPADYGVELIDPNNPELGWQIIKDTEA